MVGCPVQLQTIRGTTVERGTESCNDSCKLQLSGGSYLWMYSTLPRQCDLWLYAVLTMPVFHVCPSLQRRSQAVGSVVQPQLRVHVLSLLQSALVTVRFFSNT